MKYSTTQLTNVIKMVSALLVFFGAKPFSPDEANAIVVVVGLLGEGIAFLVSWINRHKKGDVNLAGFKK